MLMSTRLWFLLLVLGYTRSDEEFSHILKETVTAKIYHPHENRYVSSTETDSNVHLKQVEVELRVGNKKFVLDLMLNKGLISKDYFHAYQEYGQRKYDKPKIEELNFCQYFGNIRNVENSWISMSTCDGMSGIIFDGRHYYHMTKTDENNYILEKAEEGPNYHSLVDDTEVDVTDSITFNQKRQKRSIEENEGTDVNYIELVLVLDNGVHSKLGNNTLKSYLHATSIANVVNGFYSKVNIFVILVGVIVWSEEDEISLAPGRSLLNFRNYVRDNVWAIHQYDSAQLVSAVSTHTSGVGVSYVNSVCGSNSVGVNDYLSNYVSTATTVTHEMGHNLGLSHDNDFSNCTCPESQCIMIASRSMQTISFSSCSIDTLRTQDSIGRFYCLKNRPESIFSGAPVCGNNVVEPGEECDCGGVFACNTTCCNSNTCMLTENSTCATGECCDLQTCTLKHIATVCRRSKNECDLTETCDGVTEYCPVDTFKVDTETCNDGQSYCHQGFCPQAATCKRSKGVDYYKDEECNIVDINEINYDNSCSSNKFQTVVFTCGETKESFVTCTDSSYEKFYIGSKILVIFARTFTSKSRAIRCSLAMVTEISFSLPTTNMCNILEVNCSATSNLSRELSVCQGNCNGKGWCNNKGQCHCYDKFAPPSCNGPGFGGSLISGSIRNPTSFYTIRNIFLIAFLGIIFPSYLLCFFMYFYAIPRLKLRLISLLSKNKNATANEGCDGCSQDNTNSLITNNKVISSNNLPPLLVNEENNRKMTEVKSKKVKDPRSDASGSKIVGTKGKYEKKLIPRNSLPTIEPKFVLPRVVVNKEKKNERAINIPSARFNLKESFGDVVKEFNVRKSKIFVTNKAKNVIDEPSRK